MHFIHKSLDNYKPSSVIAAFIDMSKAFKKVDHNILIEDLYDMNCPPWLLKIVISFLSNRKLIFEYKGYFAKLMDLPGGTPAGCFLGAILFIVKFNGALMRPPIPQPSLSLNKTNYEDIRLKYMDDLSAAVSVQLDSVLQSDAVVRPKPLAFSERHGKILPDKCNMLLRHIESIEEFAKMNKMMVNKQKTKVMKFTRARKLDFPLEVAFSDGEHLEVINDIKLLGVMINDKLSWTTNTDYICSKAMKKLWLLRNMKKSGLTQNELKYAYVKEVRSLLEMAVPVWHSGLT